MRTYSYFKYLFLIMLLLAPLGTLHANAKHPTSVPTKKIYKSFASLSPQHRELKFQEIEKGVEERTNLFLKGKNFHKWTANRPEKEIIQEFTRLNNWRHHTWYSEMTGQYVISRADFAIAQDLLEKGYFKRPYLIAFQYNQTDSTYNSSSIVINGQRFLALEAPSKKLVPNFLRLLQNHLVTKLVRLTPASEKGVEKSAAYWLRRVKIDPTSQEQFLQAGAYSIPYFTIENWLDHQGIDPKRLLALIENVRKQYDPKKDLLACHCSGGVGRTGTFIAGLVLLQEIDNQLSKGIPISNLDISIEKTVMQLSLQRVKMVSRSAQYLTLYRLVDLYIQSKGVKS